MNSFLLVYNLLLWVNISKYKHQTNTCVEYGAIRIKKMTFLRVPWFTVTSWFPPQGTPMVQKNTGSESCRGADKPHLACSLNDKIPPANGKIPENSRFPNWQFLWVYIHGTKKLSDKPTGIYIENVNDVEESLNVKVLDAHQYFRCLI